MIGIPYDPYDYEIDADPYPIWKRMRDEAPLYDNHTYDFYAVTRYADARDMSVDWPVKLPISSDGSSPAAPASPWTSI